MTYRDNVRAAAAALKSGEDANWELARLTFESTLSKGDVSNQQNKVSVATWSADVRSASGRRFAEYTAGTYRRIWEKYGLGPAQDRPSWTDAYADIRGGTVGERMVDADFNRAIANASPEQKQKAFATLAREPEVIADHATSAEVFAQIAYENPKAVETAWKDTETNIALSTARVNARQEVLAPPPPPTRLPPPSVAEQDTTLKHSTFLTDVTSRVDRWAADLDDIAPFLERTTDVPRLRRWTTRNALDRLIRAATRCRDVLPASATEVDNDEVVEHRAPRSRGRLASA